MAQAETSASYEVRKAKARGQAGAINAQGKYSRQQAAAEVQCRGAIAVQRVEEVQRMAARRCRRHAAVACRDMLRAMPLPAICSTSDSGGRRRAAIRRWLRYAIRERMFYKGSGCQAKILLSLRLCQRYAAGVQRYARDKDTCVQRAVTPRYTPKPGNQRQKCYRVAAAK